jgi:hypothetical protein
MTILHKEAAGALALVALFALSADAPSLAGEFSYDVPGAR